MFSRMILFKVLRPRLSTLEEMAEFNTTIQELKKTVTFRQYLILKKIQQWLDVKIKQNKRPIIRQANWLLVFEDLCRCKSTLYLWSCC